MSPVGFENVAAAKAFRIAPGDTNYFALLFDPVKDKVDHVFVIEIFNVGGATRQTRILGRMSSFTFCTEKALRFAAGLNARCAKGTPCFCSRGMSMWCAIQAHRAFILSP